MISHRVVSAVLSVLLLIVWRHRRKQQAEQDVKVTELELPEMVSQKVLYYRDAAGDGAELGYHQSSDVPLRRHPNRRRDRRLRREEVRASIRMSLNIRDSHLIGPEDEVFRQFIIDRLAEADQDPHVPPYDCLRIYAYEGSGTPTGSLSSLESWMSEAAAEPPASNPRPCLVRLTPWYGTGVEDTTFWDDALHDLPGDVSLRRSCQFINRTRTSWYS